MYEETKKLENTELTDEQAENVAGGLQEFIESTINDEKSLLHQTNNDEKNSFKSNII